MNNDRKKYWTDDPEMVEKYVLNRFSAGEKERLDAEISGCEPCKEKLREEMEIAAGIRRYGRDILKARLRKKLVRERATQFYSYQYIGLAAAVIIIAVGIGLYQVWFSDLVAPKKFNKQEFVLKPQQDSLDIPVESPRDESGSLESRQHADRSGTTTEREPLTSRREHIEIADRRIADQSASGAMSSPQQVQPSAGAMAESDALLGEEKSNEGQSSAVWLIGKVVMIGKQIESSPAAASKMEMSKKSDSRSAKEKSSEQKLVVSRRAKDEGIVLQQRSMKDIPPGRSQQRAVQKEEIETLLERTETGLSLTLYDDTVKDSDLQNAVIETMTEDSLVVSLPTQRIAYRLPSGWNSQSSPRR